MANILFTNGEIGTYKPILLMNIFDNLLAPASHMLRFGDLSPKPNAELTLANSALHYHNETQFDVWRLTIVVSKNEFDCFLQKCVEIIDCRPLFVTSTGQYISPHELTYIHYTQFNSIQRYIHDALKCNIHAFIDFSHSNRFTITPSPTTELIATGSPPHLLQFIRRYYARLFLYDKLIETAITANNHSCIPTFLTELLDNSTTNHPKYFTQLFINAFTCGNLYCVDILCHEKPPIDVPYMIQYIHQLISLLNTDTTIPRVMILAIKKCIRLIITTYDIPSTIFVI